MSKNREVICLDELITKIRENKEIGEIMRSVMIEIVKSCKTIQKEEMKDYKQIRREEVMPKLTENKNIYCVAIYDEDWGKDIYALQQEKIRNILSMIKSENVVFYERTEESEEAE